MTVHENGNSECPRERVLFEALLGPGAFALRLPARQQTATA